MYFMPFDASSVCLYWQQDLGFCLNADIAPVSLIKTFASFVVPPHVFSNVLCGLAFVVLNVPVEIAVFVAVHIPTVAITLLCCILRVDSTVLCFARGLLHL